jgi:hypothetical protein
MELVQGRSELMTESEDINKTWRKVVRKEGNGRQNPLKLRADGETEKRNDQPPATSTEYVPLS